MGPIRRRRNTPAFGTDFFSRSFFWRRFVSPTRIDCGASLLASCSALIRERRRFDCARRFSFPLSVRRYLSSARFLAAFRTSSLAKRRQFSPQKTWAGWLGVKIRLQDLSKQLHWDEDSFEACEATGIGSGFEMGKREWSRRSSLAVELKLFSEAFL